MWQRILSTLLVISTVHGCSQTEQGSESKPNLVLPVVELPRQEWSTPLSASEIQSFVTIVEHLPKQRVPEITAPANASRTMSPSASADEFILAIRKEYRRTLDMRALGDSWERDGELARRFSGMQVNPEVFAALTTRISLAWAATAIRQEIPVLKTERKIRERLEFLAWRYDHPEIANLASSERDNLAVEIEQAVALSEFLALIKTVPDESLTVVAENAERLERYLPKSNPTSQFERIVESHPEVVRVGHATKSGPSN